ncbi:MAG: IS1634 family transposase [Bacteroidetes bacterium]|nr:IS1634 family transposase [Bacteroidota bacterium]
MFIKLFSKYNKTTKQRYTIYSLYESYRHLGRVCQRSVICLGKLDELETEEQKKQLALRIEELIKHGGHIFPIGIIDSKVELLAQYYYNEIKRRRRYDTDKQQHGDWVTVDMTTLKNKDAREIGAEWMCKQALDQLGIYDFLKSHKWDDEKISIAATHIISRAVYPASELKTVSFIKENSAISEITGIDCNKLTKDTLYSISHKLYSEKDSLEQHLSKQTNELFDLEDKLILYDLTNTYFEGRMQGSKKAKFGRSKEKRSDARIIVLAVVVNSEGFLKYSNIFEGNMTDCKTLEMVILHLSQQTSFTSRKPIIVIDAGIGTDENIAMLKSKGYDYMSVARSGLKEYYADVESKPVQIKDKRKQPIELLKVRTDKNDDQYLWVKSEAKALKEQSMNGLLSQRFEERIENIRAGILKKGGVKKIEKVYERLGRLKEKYPSVHKYYDVTIADNGKGLATAITYKHKAGIDTDKKAGIYFLRTSLKGTDETTLWTIYNTIREIEYTFRVLKTDLDLRPIYHKTDEASMAHLHLGILAYWLVNTVRYQLKQKGYNHDWREIIRIMNTQKCVTTSIENINNEIISVRQCTEPTAKVKEIYDLLNYKYAPFVRKKSVVLPAETFKNESA